MKPLHLILLSSIVLLMTIHLGMDISRYTKGYSNTMNLKVTAYNAEVGQTDLTPFITASNLRVKSGGIAVSRDLFNRGWTFEKKVYIEGLGIYTITDLMNSKISKTIDIYLNKKDLAKKFGNRTLEVTLL